MENIEMELPMGGGLMMDEDAASTVGNQCLLPYGSGHNGH
jgi:hypothetical protein